MDGCRCGCSAPPIPIEISGDLADAPDDDVCLLRNPGSGQYRGWVLAAFDSSRIEVLPFEFWAGPFWAPLQAVAVATELLYNEVLIRQPGRQ